MNYMTKIADYEAAVERRLEKSCELRVMFKRFWVSGMNARTYIMLDAAVASEAYRPELQADSDSVISKYRPGDWTGYDSLSWAANWYTWFTNTPNDARADIGWAGHFAPLLNRQGLDVFNFYSSGDEVFKENAEVPGLARVHGHGYHSKLPH